MMDQMDLAQTRWDLISLLHDVVLDAENEQRCYQWQEKTVRCELKDA